MSKQSFFIAGLVAVIAGAFLFFVGIPYGVSTPSNVRNLVLSPLFWPNILSALLALGGIGLILTSLRLPAGIKDERLSDVSGGWARLIATAGIMLAYVALISTIGLVWMSILAILSVAWLMQSKRPVVTGIVAVAAPLLLYAFFAHVAGVGIPQGELVRLP